MIKHDSKRWHEHLLARPWLERLLKPCLAARRTGLQGVDRFAGFRRYGEAQIAAVKEDFGIDDQLLNRLIDAMDKAESRRGVERIAAIDDLIERAFELTKPRSNLSESASMRARHRIRAQAVEEAALPAGPRIPDDFLTEPLSVLPKVGPRTAKLLAAKGLYEIEDLMNWLPAGYEDRSNESSVNDLVIDDVVSVRVKVEKGERGGGGGRGRPRFELHCRDEDGNPFSAVFFSPNPSYWARMFEKAPGQWYRFFGKVLQWQKKPGMFHPKVEKLKLGREADVEGKGLVPVYPDIPGINPNRLRDLIDKAMGFIGRRRVLDPLPAGVRKKAELPDLKTAWRLLHQPEDEDEAKQRKAAAERFAYQELFLTQIGLLLRREEAKQEAGLRLLGEQDFRALAKAELPFKPTRDQLRCLKEVEGDLISGKPMNRLLQGDVGSGKTAVGAISALALAKSGLQTALMAPTEILARQHHRSISQLLGGQLRVGLLLGSSKAAERRAFVQGATDGSLDLLVGTHALIAQNIPFKALGLAIIDEQHRFGVAQRGALREAGIQSTGFIPHSLAMTATPIPRTLSMTLYGDLDVSTIKEMPPGRQPVNTRAFSLANLRPAVQIAERELARNRRVFIVLPLVRESDKVELADAERTYMKLRGGPLGHYGVGLVHGQMKSQEKKDVMETFRRGEIRVLVSTTVVEVGVDVPEATVMMIWHAERFGLSQLHQLRGRVGRGQDASHCLLLYDPQAGEKAIRRISVLARSNDGFEIAWEDLQERGAGELAGLRQSGSDRFEFADLLRDGLLARSAREQAVRVLRRDPELKSPGNQGLRAVLDGRFSKRLKWLSVS